MQGSKTNSIFEFAPLSSQHRLSILYRKMMEKKYDLQREAPLQLSWDENYFNLSGTTLFNKLDPVQKQSLLELLNERLFASFLYVERSGLTFGAKMILASETLEEKTLYASFVEEESRHYMEFNRIANLTTDKEKHWIDMLDILGNSILEAEKETMIYIIHVLLEGFSITHYKVLANACLDPRLKESFGRILEDEGRHHAMGYSEHVGHLSPSTKDQIFEYTRSFINNMKRTNPVISAYEILFGKLSNKDSTIYLEESKSHLRQTQRLSVFENIVKRNDHYSLFDKLKENGIFSL